MVLLEARFFVDENRRENALTLPPNPTPFSPSLFSGFLPPLWFIPAFLFLTSIYLKSHWSWQDRGLACLGLTL